jgi:hypothetical protein
LPSWIRIRIPNTDPDPLARLNTDPIRIRIRNPEQKWARDEEVGSLGRVHNVQYPLLHKFFPQKKYRCVHRSGALRGQILLASYKNFMNRKDTNSDPELLFDLGMYGYHLTFFNEDGKYLSYLSRKH